MMQQIVNDLGSNLEENLERWAKILRHVGKKKKVFDVIYSSKKASWTNSEIAANTNLPSKAAGEAANALYGAGLLNRISKNPPTYSKRPDVYGVKRRLLTLAQNHKRLEALPTKRRPSEGHRERRYTEYMRGRAIHITIDEIDSFAKVKKIDSETVPQSLNPPRLPEETFKHGIENILGERTKLKDWGGENLDIYSTNLVIKGRRVAAGFALKGPAQKGSLTPQKMGANSDQIERLFRQSINIAIVQYEGDIAESIPSLMEILARDKARSEDKNIYYCIINILDSYRLRMAYPKAFQS